MEDEMEGLEKGKERWEEEEEEDRKGMEGLDEVDRRGMGWGGRSLKAENAAIPGWR